jgi:ABC-type amino acid transport system permease subunit
MNRILAYGLFLCLTFFASAQEVEMADDFRGEGKIFVVVAVILIILIGIFLYLFRVEKSIRRLEQELKEKKKES